MLRTVYTGSSGNYDILLLPFEINSYEKVITSFTVAFSNTDTENNIDSQVKKLDIVYKNKNRENISINPLVRKKKKNKFQITFPKNFALTKANCDSKKFFMTINYYVNHHSVLILEWKYKLYDTTGDEEILFPASDIAFSKLMNLDFYLVERYYIENNNEFIFVLFNQEMPKNQIGIYRKKKNNFSLEFYDISSEKELKKIADETKKCVDLGKVFYYCKKSTKKDEDTEFYTQYFEKVKIIFGKSQNKIVIQDVKGNYSCQFLRMNK